jgi:hypothetical protein
MAARTTDEHLARSLEHLPPAFHPLRSVLVGIAAQLHLADALAADLATTATVAGAEGPWLTMLARGQGVRRANGEQDVALRSRLRNIEDLVTPPAVLAAVESVLDLYDDNPASIVEHFAAPHMALDVDAACDLTDLFDRNPGFTVLVPPIDGVEGHPGHAAIYAEIRRVKAFGVPAWMFIYYP